MSDIVPAEEIVILAGFNKQGMFEGMDEFPENFDDLPDGFRDWLANADREDMNAIADAIYEDIVYEDIDIQFQAVRAAVKRFEEEGA